MHFACWIKGCRQTLRIGNNYFFSTATIVAWTRLNATLYVHCSLSCKILLTLKMNSEFQCMLPIGTHDSWRGYKARQMILGNAVPKQPSVRLLPSHCYPLFAPSSSEQKFTVHYEVTPLFFKFWFKISVNSNNLFFSLQKKIHLVSHRV